MKNTSLSILAGICLTLAAFLGGLFVGRNMRGIQIETSVHVSIDHNSSSPGPQLPTAGKKVNINTADLQTLMTLNGIGEVYAQNIIDYRTKHGPFSKIEDIQNVPGIGPKRFEAIMNHITTGG